MAAENNGGDSAIVEKVADGATEEDQREEDGLRQQLATFSVKGDDDSSDTSSSYNGANYHTPPESHKASVTSTSAPDNFTSNDADGSNNNYTTIDDDSKNVSDVGADGGKTYVERRVQRRLLWGTVGFGISIGHLLSRAGVRGAHLKTMRGITKIGGGIRRAKLEGVHHAKHQICGVKVRVYRPEPASGGAKPVKMPVVLFIHGGGWVMCTARTYHTFTLELCRDVGAIVVSIDYRLAPEHPYPASLDDCLAVTRAVLNADVNPNQCGPELAGWVDVNRVVVVGDSAGGNLSAAVGLELVREGDRRLHALGLICPSLQAITVKFDSHQKFGINSTARSSWFLANYAGVEPNPKLLKAIDEGNHVPSDVFDSFVEKYVEPLFKKQDSQLTLSNFSKTSSASVLRKVDSQPDNERINDSGCSTTASSSREKLDKLMTSSYSAAVLPSSRSVDGAMSSSMAMQPAEIVPDAVTKLATSKRAWPLLADDADLAQLPTTMIQICSDDSLRDEGRVFCDRLRQCGVPDVRYCFVPRAQHCEAIFHRTLPTKAARLGYSQIVDFVKDVTSTGQSQ